MRRQSVEVHACGFNDCTWFKNEFRCSFAPHNFGLAPANVVIRGSHANRVCFNKFPLLTSLLAGIEKTQKPKMTWQRANADNGWRCRWSQELLPPILLPACDWFNQCSKLCHFCCRLCSWMSDDSCEPPETSFTMASQEFLRILFEKWLTTLWISVFACHAVRASDVSHYNIKSLEILWCVWTTQQLISGSLCHNIAIFLFDSRICEHLVLWNVRL